MSCLFCASSVQNNDKFYIETSTTSHGSLLLNILNKIVTVSVNYASSSLCNECFALLEEFEVAERKYNSIKTKINDYLSVPKKTCPVETKNAFSQTENVRKASKNVTEPLSIDSKKETGKITCQLCKFRFSTVTAYKKHRKTHEPVKEYKCDICDKQFRSKTGADFHKTKQHPESVVKEETILCDVDLLRSIERTDEYYDESQQQNADAENDDVDEKLATVNKKLRGRKKKDADVATPFQCPECPKKWKTSSDLRNHRNSHSQIRPYICEVCGQAYKQKAALDVHIGMHNGINPFSCPYCNKAFTQKGALQRHIPIHTGEAPYQCDLCGKRFVHHTSFNMHRLTHSGQKDYKCDVCGLALLSGSHLKRHTRVHTGERAYACQQCGKRFAERYNLMAHQRLHDASNSTREVRRNFRCQICGQSYERRLKLEEHLANEHHKITQSDVSKDWMGNLLDGSENLWTDNKSGIKPEVLVSSQNDIDINYQT